jgi:hypothetical protein
MKDAERWSHVMLGPKDGPQSMTCLLSRDLVSLGVKSPRWQAPVMGSGGESDPKRQEHTKARGLGL